MTGRHGVTSESKIGIAVLQILAGSPSGTSTIQSLIKKIPKYVNLTAEDREQSITRPGEEMWEQRVRNIKSHDKTSGNLIAEGLLSHPKKGSLSITDAGRAFLKHKGL
ncbi:MAG: winged helix-turn-helix domain-containing protein [Parvibaculum sp.]|nr:winged helix-turn-helix domain-containing protein [Parvibaculum sp.]